MLVLGIETATKVCSVALIRQSQLVAESKLNIRNAHAAQLFQLIENIYNAAQLSARDLDGIAVSNGPGSFTGLRIGVAAAKGIATAIEKPIAIVNTLEALAARTPLADGTICPLLKARSGEFYTAIYQRKNFEDTCINDTTVVKANRLLSFLPKPCLVIGHTADIPEIKDVTMAPAVFSYPSAISVAAIGERELMSGHYADVDTFEPNYGQDFFTRKPKAHASSRV